jgi:hypothetical protein
LDLDPILNKENEKKSTNDHKAMAVGYSRQQYLTATSPSLFEDNFVELNNQAISLPSSPRRITVGATAAPHLPGPKMTNVQLASSVRQSANKIPIRPEVSMAIEREIQQRQLQASHLKQVTTPDGVQPSLARTVSSRHFNNHNAFWSGELLYIYGFVLMLIIHDFYY